MICAMRSALRVALTIFCVNSFQISASFAAEDAENSPTNTRYTFSWPLSTDQIKPRGGSTRGAPVQPETAASAAWKKLREDNISDFERDRRAILAMAGTYRVTFDFLEVSRFDSAQKAQAPYQSWGTEKVYVDADTSNFISLVHILEMRIVEDDGKISEPFVTKHWRQDWRYEPTQIIEYIGNDRWQKRAIKNTRESQKQSSQSQFSQELSSQGQWLQTVYQVDESPRYASIGRWQHNAAFSTWLSGETWRPLPRREWSVRNNYQVLIGTNRHTITPSGWLQEENNLKAVINADRKLDATKPFLAREYGVARYERIRDEGFAEADHYFQRTRQFWDEVRDAWSNTFTRYTSITLRGPVDKLGLFAPLFDQADKIVETEKAATNNAEVIKNSLQAMGVPIDKP